MEQKKILIVEDDRIIAADIKKTLEKSGYNIVSVMRTGKDAIKTAIKERPDLVLLDIMLEGKMNGIDTGEVISQKMNIPIIYLTALTDDETFLNANLTSPAAFLGKPFRHNQLLKAVKEAVK